MFVLPTGGPCGSNPHGFLQAAAGNVLLGNRVTGAPGDGISLTPGPLTEPQTGCVVPGVTDTVLRHNTTNRNGHDGIKNDAPSTTLINNTANRNANIGIESVPGARDGGGNRADFNGVAGCTNLVCG
jgi:hypothetical protein